jgi:deazaflavin-dependent oxidoreductase (nitroreductase family)
LLLSRSTPYLPRERSVRKDRVAVPPASAVTKRRLVRFLQKYLVNPPVRLALALGVVPPTHALLETVGRRSGQPRRNPVGNGLDDDGRTFWIVAEHGRDANYVRNIEADPGVRVRIGRTWRTGRAQLLPDDDPHARLRTIGRPVNALMVRAMGTELLTVRVDLDPADDGQDETPRP